MSRRTFLLLLLGLGLLALTLSVVSGVRGGGLTAEPPPWLAGLGRGLGGRVVRPADLDTRGCAPFREALRSGVLRLAAGSLCEVVVLPAGRLALPRRLTMTAETANIELTFRLAGRELEVRETLEPNSTTLTFPRGGGAVALRCRSTAVCRALLER